MQVSGHQETGAKNLLGTTIASGTSASQALDAVCAHPSMAPFFCRQLIQRLVTSNPSPVYVARVAAVFNNDGAGCAGLGGGQQLCPSDWGALLSPNGTLVTALLGLGLLATFVYRARTASWPQAGGGKAPTLSWAGAIHTFPRPTGAGRCQLSQSSFSRSSKS